MKVVRLKQPKGHPPRFQQDIDMLSHLTTPRTMKILFLLAACGGMTRRELTTWLYPKTTNPEERVLQENAVGTSLRQLCSRRGTKATAKFQRDSNMKLFQLKLDDYVIRAIVDGLLHKYARKAERVRAKHFAIQNDVNQPFLPVQPRRKRPKGLWAVAKEMRREEAAKRKAKKEKEAAKKAKRKAKQNTKPRGK